MADLYTTSVQDILAGFECNTRKDGNPYDGERLGVLRYYKGVKSYDIVSHDDEEALLFVVTDYHMVLVVAAASKLTDMCSACVAEDAPYHYEDRNGKIIFRCADKEKLVRRLLDIDWSYVEPEDEYEDDEYCDDEYCDDDSEGEPEGEPEEDAAEAARQAALAQAQADLEAQRAAKVKAKSDAIVASLRRADAEEAAADAAAANAPATSMEKAVAIVTERGSAPAKQNPGKTDWHVDAGDLSEFE